MPKKEILIPYDSSGSILWEQPWDKYDPATGEYGPDKRYTWRKPEPFTARLKFHAIKTIRSGYTVRMMDADTGAIYPMKGEEFLGLIPEMMYGALPVMRWEPYKVGNNYNIRRVNTG